MLDRILSSPNSVVLDYDSQLILRVNTSDINWLVEKTFYKTRLKHKVASIDGNIIFFNDDLAYPDYINIDNVLSKKVPLCGYLYSVTDRYREYVESRNLYIEKRASLGIELKTNAGRLDERYIKFKNIVDERMVRRLREKQMQDAFFMFAMAKSGNFSVPGSGKTSSALAVYTFLKANDLVDRIVMIGPKNAFGSWIDEFEACFGSKEKLRCFNSQSSEYKNTYEKKYVLKYSALNFNLFLFNYEGAFSCLEEIKNIVGKRTLLVFDEVHKVKAINGQRASCALEIAKCAVYTIAMTGTPIPNSYLDLYNLLHILYNDEYRDFFGFDTSYLRNPTFSEIDNINRRIQPFFCRTTKKQLNVPEANEDIVERVFGSAEEQSVFEIICKKYRNNKLALFIRVLQLESNPRLLLETLDLSEFSSVLNITDNIDEIDYVDYSYEIQRAIRAIEITSKKKACMQRVKELVKCGKSVIVWCIFIDSIKSIAEQLDSIGIKSKIIMGEVDLDERTRIIDGFRKGQFDVLITNPHTLAESVSLHSVCHDAVYFEYSYNLVHLLQSKDRIHRLGLPDNQYTQYYYMQNVFTMDDGEISIDANVYNRLLEKERIMLDAIDNQTLEPVYTPEEDLQMIFKNIL